jgi:hypothetical protein
MRKHALRAFGLCLMAALSLMAFAAVSAQAETGATWDVNGVALPAGLEPTVKGAIENKTGTLLTKIAGAEVEILCTTGETKEFKLKPNGTALGLITFTGCLTRLNKVLSKDCVPLDKGVAGTILTLELEGLIVLHLVTPNGTAEPLVRLIPDPPGSNAFAHIEFGEFCSLPEEILIGGTYFLKDCKNLFKTSLKVHLVDEHSLTHIWAISDTPEHAAHIDGSVELELSGEKHVGLNWSGLPKTTKV